MVYAVDTDTPEGSPADFERTAYASLPHTTRRSA